jgi:predicted Zn-dependent protease
VYGKDPRDGFFREGRFYHPRLRFQLTFPSGWQTENLTQAVVAVAPENRAVLQLTLAQGGPDSAYQQFFSQQGVARGRSVQDRINGNPAVMSEFQAQTEQGVVQGLVGFISHDNRTYQVIGYTPASIYGNYGAGMEATIRSFAPVSDPSILNVQPLRMDIVQTPGAITVDEFARRFDSAVPASTLALINQVPGPDSRLPAGLLVKRVVGTAVDSRQASDR